MRLALALIASSTGAVAQDCPTAADLDAGKTITLSSTIEPVFMENRITPRGLAITSVRQFSGQNIRIELFFEHPLALPHSGSGARTEYETSLDELDNLATLRTWSSEVTVFEGAEEIGRITQTLDLTALGSATLSGCEYTIWRIDESISDEDGQTRFGQKVYAPDLGLMIAEYGLNENGNRIGGLSFDQIAAE
ncbi:hypothetical protein Q4555_06295 [Octadecabacter sp. 1_MG-2023]|uniref:hypothetical protein n=1 Tax=unclassified Octadecabacter TaxID=196158 RepID=UPI001C08609C|nr:MULTISPECIES: hypothetical protein [unclassified Octadecabacter]MBU2994439.1 hypothetical protein [Octadecabacter sp. B2R22]MDO6734270.1 hypothetical protein [Octadecabacter sp. 1_MG-2023]